MSQPVVHEGFTVARAYPVTAARLFAAHSDPVKKFNRR